MPEFLASPPSDIISAVQFSPSPARQTLLAVSSWDKSVRIYDTNTPDKGAVTQFEHAAPVLDCCWGEGGEERNVFSGGLDWLVKS